MSDPNDSNDRGVPDGQASEPSFEPRVELVLPAGAYDEIIVADGGEGGAVGDRPVQPPENLSQAVEPTFDTKPILDAIDSLGKTFETKLDQLRASFDREIRAEGTRERIVDRLHAELQEYKQDLVLKVLKPMFIDLIQLHDDMGKLVESQANVGEDSAESTRRIDVLNGLRQGIEDVLYRQGVEPFSCEEPTFDPRRQRSIAAIPTEDPSLAKTIAVRHRKGFQSGEKIIRPELVSVYTLKTQAR